MCAKSREGKDDRDKFFKIPRFHIYIIWILDNYNKEY